MTAPSTVVFDLGGVLIDWDPRHLYRRLLPDDEIDDFLDEIGFAEWNHAQDAGGSWDEAVEALAARHPHRRELIAAYPRRYPETMAGPIEGTVRLLTQLRAAGTRLLALTNWSAETFHHAVSTFGFLEMFEDIVVSGVEGVAKPDPRLFTLLIERFALVPAETVFIDDSAANVAAAAELGLTALRFRDPDALRADLRRLGLPVDA
ncbi:MAG: HAD family hydrolase [Actinomycetes bacterium]